MNVYDPYPETVTVDGEEIRVNLAFDRVLKALDVQNMDDLTQADKLELQCKLLLPEPPESIAQKAKALTAIFDTLPKGDSGDRHLDFHQDAKLIRSAFLRIGIDLTQSHMHFFQFLELLGDLPTDCALMRVIEIRQKPVPKLTESNKEYVSELMKAKARYAIEMSDEERRARFAAKLKETSSILRG